MGPSPLTWGKSDMEMSVSWESVIALPLGALVVVLGGFTIAGIILAVMYMLVGFVHMVLRLLGYSVLSTSTPYVVPRCYESISFRPIWQFDIS
jgi:hypothetical protein